jgi:hypothetical protein
MPVVRLLAAASPAFGGEDPLLGRPWYHQQLTRSAALAAGWSPAAADDVAWHALAVDAYLYNPIRRFPLDRGRRHALRDLRRTLLALHFDDLFTGAAIAQMWDRYTAGCVAAVLWCSGRGDVAGARHAVGLTLHAVQDFYSHSNWVDDPARRARTWWEVPAAERRDATLVTGAYRLPPAHGSHPHGDIALSRPWARTGADAPATALGSRLLGRLVDLRPRGMSLDSRWQARIGTSVRGLDGTDAGELFEIALDLAGRTSRQWLSMLDSALSGLGVPVARFWADVREVVQPAATRARAFDGAGHQPGRMVAAGVYPPPERATGTGGGWFLHTAPHGSAAGAAIVPLLLGPYDELPTRLPVPPHLRDRPVEVFAFRACWPLAAGFVHGAGTIPAATSSPPAGRRCSAGPGPPVLSLDRSALVRVPAPVSSG